MIRPDTGTAAALLLAGAMLLAVPCASAQSITITLLGTGAPMPSMERFGPATLIEAGGQAFLIDAGRGAVQRMTQAGKRWGDVDAVLLTHLHSDHVVGLPDLWLTGWLLNPGRTQPLAVWGPRGTASMVAHLRQAFAVDIQQRQVDDGASAAGAELAAADVADGVVHDSGGVRITAFPVDHLSGEPALGYRIDHAGRSVVLSGDTRLSDNLVRHAIGVDVLVHEVASRESFVRMGVPAARIEGIMARHVTPEQAGQVFARTRPRLAVYSHIIHAAATDDDLIPGTRREYDGPLEVGVDLMVITVGDSIEVRRPAGRDN